MKLPDGAPDVCARLAGGEPIEVICAAGAPSLETVNRWLADHAAFRRRYAEARRLYAAKLAYQIVEIADAIPPDGGEDEVRRGRLRIEARKWVVSQMAETPVPPEESTPPPRRIVFCRPDGSGAASDGSDR